MKEQFDIYPINFGSHGRKDPRTDPNTRKFYQQIAHDFFSPHLFGYRIGSDGEREDFYGAKVQLVECSGSGKDLHIKFHMIACSVRFIIDPNSNEPIQEIKVKDFFDTQYTVKYNRVIYTEYHPRPVGNEAYYPGFEPIPGVNIVYMEDNAYGPDLEYRKPTVLEDLHKYLESYFNKYQLRKFQIPFPYGTDDMLTVSYKRFMEAFDDATHGHHMVGHPCVWYFSPAYLSENHTPDIRI